MGAESTMNSYYKANEGVAFLADGNGGRRKFCETARGNVPAGVFKEVLDLVLAGCGSEEALLAGLSPRYSPERIYYALIRLEKDGLIVNCSERRMPGPEELFLSGVGGGAVDQAAMAVRIVSLGCAGEAADAVKSGLGASSRLSIEWMTDWKEAEAGGHLLYVVLTPDYLEPDLEGFGRMAFERGLSWIPVKAQGIIPCLGPLFVAGKTGCIECLLDRVRGHRREEVESIREGGNKQSLRLSVAYTAHSLRTIAALLTVELEKFAAGAETELIDSVRTLDFRSLSLDRHSFLRRPQCLLCGSMPTGQKAGSALPVALSAQVIPLEPLQLQSRKKADYHDGGERVCSAVETLDRYSRLISPITGILGPFTHITRVPECFGPIINSEWILRGRRPSTGSNGDEPKLSLGVSTGKGRTEAQARASTLGEAIERYSSQYEGYEPRIRASFAELGDIALHPHELLGFSERQYARRKATNGNGHAAFVPEPYDAARQIDWVPAWSLTHARWRLVPAAFAFYKYPLEGGGDICMGDSNGVASGNCIEEALMHGFYELVERDGSALWWYTRLRKPAVDWRTFSSAFVEAVDATVREHGLHLEILDLTTDLAIPVFSANLFRREGDELRFCGHGLGCHRDPRIAIERAVSELGQSWLGRDVDKFSLRFQPTPISGEIFLQADPVQEPKTLRDFPFDPRGDFLDDIHEAVSLLRGKDLEMLIVDLTRPDVGFPVARVIAPGLLHFWPRFGCRRLYTVPRKMGWVDSEIAEENLNPVPSYW